MRHLTTRRTLLAGSAAALATGRAKAQAAARPIRIGVLTDMGGTYADITGPGSVVGAQIAVEDFTKANPSVPVELLSADLQLKPDVALGIAGDWFDNKGVDLITDVPLSSAALAIGELAKARDKLAVYTGAASSVLSGERCGPNHLHWNYDTWALPHAAVEATLREGGTSWFFITADYTYGHSLQRDAANFVLAGGGTVVGNAPHPFPGTTDFSAFLLQAMASGAKVVGLAHGGSDAVNCIKQAAEFGIVRKGQKVVGLGLLMTNVQAIGLQSAQGVLLSEPYYWDYNEGTRAFGRRFAARMPNRQMPDSVQAGQYSAVTHYLKTAVAICPARAQSSGRGMIAAMRELPIHDDIYGESLIRPDGRVIHPMYLLEAKTPDQSTEPWDLLTVKGIIPAERAFRPIDEGNCPLAHS